MQATERTIRAYGTEDFDNPKIYNNNPKDYLSCKTSYNNLTSMSYVRKGCVLHLDDEGVFFDPGNGRASVGSARKIFDHGRSNIHNIKKDEYI